MIIEDFMLDYGINLCDLIDIQEHFIVKLLIAPLLSHNMVNLKYNIDDVLILFRSDLSENQILNTIDLIRKGINQKFQGYPNTRFYCQRNGCYEII